MSPPAPTLADQQRAFDAFRRVRSNGEIKWAGERIYLSEVLVGEPVGLVPYDDRRRAVMFSHMEIGLLDGYCHAYNQNPRQGAAYVFGLAHPCLRSFSVAGG